MILEHSVLNKKEFLEEFNKKIANFLDKSPLFVRYTINGDTILLYDFSRNVEEKPIKFDIDYTIEVKENIRHIRDFLASERYPVLEVIDRTEKSPDAIEIQEAMNRGLTFTEAANKKIIKETKTQYRIEKIFNHDNRASIRKLSKDGNEEEKSGLYELRVPVAIFLREVYNNPQNAVLILQTKSKLIKYLEDVR